MELTQFIKEEIKKLAFKQVEDHDSLLKSGILDSITAIDLSVALEDRLSIKIPFTDIDEKNFESVNAIIHYLESKFSIKK